MPSDTNPLPAQTLLALCNEMADAIEGREVTGTEECQRMEYAVRDYRAARAASPVTLEEALLIWYHKAHHAKQDYMRNRNVDEKEMALSGEWIAALNAVENNARRLAGEGGASGQ